MVIPRHNDYHIKDPWQDYNFWLIGAMRETFQIIDDPKDQLFISRRGIRRGIAHEDDELFTELRSSILPNLTMILPDDFSVAEQMQIFANAKLIDQHSKAGEGCADGAFGIKASGHFLRRHDVSHKMCRILTDATNRDHRRHATCRKVASIHNSASISIYSSCDTWN
ncbi:MAG: glycosyltransferase family 61 protein [Gammaproteobacteria bacterium]|nr:glycosyltransferase family 61 protein [Gammaproteobacteria bacterium]